MRPDLPTGTVTFLFTDVEGSTKLLHELGAEPYAEALAEHRRIVREACAAQGGVEVDTQGDAFFFAFPTAPGAVEAAPRRTAASRTGRSGCGSGCTRGPPLRSDEGTWAWTSTSPLASAARATAARSSLAADRGSSSTLELTDLGEHRLKDIAGAGRRSSSSATTPSLRSRRSRTRTCPVRRAPSWGGSRSLRDVLARIEGGARLVTLTGPGGIGQDPPGARGGVDARRRVQGRRLLGRAGRAPRPHARHRDDRADARREGRARRRTSASGSCSSCSTTWSR